MNDDRIDRLEARLTALEREVRRGVAAVASAPEPLAGPVLSVAAVPTAAARPPTAPASFEALIAGRGLQIAGALLVLVGCAFFLDLAFTRGWIGPAERIVLGLAAGAAAIVFGARIASAKYQPIAASLIGLGAGIDYLSLWAAVARYPELHVSRSAAFAAMIAVTAVLGALSAKRGSQTIALFGAAGGFLTPALLSSGTADRVVLSAYLLVLTLGALGLAARKAFGTLEIVTLAGVLAYARSFAPSPFDGWSTAAAQVVATLFFVVFGVAMSFGRASGAALQRRVALLAASVASYVVVLEAIFADAQRTLGIDLLVVAALLLAIARIRALERTIAQTCGYLALGASSLALAALLHGTTLLDAFAFETAALYFVGTRTGDRKVVLAAGAGLAITGLAVTSHVADPHVAWPSVLTSFAIWLACAGAVLFESRRSSRESSEMPAYGIARVGFDMVAVAALSRAAADVFGGPYDLSGVSSGGEVAVSLAWTGYATALFLYGLRARLSLLRWEALVLFACTMLKVFTIDLSSVALEWRVLSLVVLGAVLFGMSATYTRAMARPGDAGE